MPPTPPIFLKSRNSLFHSLGIFLEAVFLSNLLSYYNFVSCPNNPPYSIPVPPQAPLPATPPSLWSDPVYGQALDLLVVSLWLPLT